MRTLLLKVFFQYLKDEKTFFGRVVHSSESFQIALNTPLGYTKDIFINELEATEQIEKGRIRIMLYKH